ncbi:ExeM/NucH family extracellular endonuclease [uncultured Hymenobacter sp.]|uniref:ExeM/NucH family extracellular endonuclease n=1 Tax=uncultured Hymenobacter sp. TaxID=170016 RepID=UPI0035C980A1
MKHFLRALAALLLLTQNLVAQQVLTTSPFKENFNNIGAGLPANFTVRTGATATSLGTPVALTTAATNRNNTAGAFKNFASADVAEGSATDRALGVRQSGSFGDPGAAFVFQINNTLNKTGFALKFELQSLDASSPRLTTWRVDYGVGAEPTAFAPATATGTLTTGGSTFTNNVVNVDFGQTLNNLPDNVWIRLVALSPTTGSGNRASSAIDDFELSWNNATTGPPTLAISPATLSFGTQNVGTSSAGKPYTLNSSNLDGTQVQVATTAPFAVAKTSTGPYASSLTYTAAELATGSTPVYVQFSPTTTGAATGTITNSGGGAELQTVSVSGSGFDPNLITKISSIQGTGATVAAGTYNVEAIVTGVYATLNPAGFYVQEEDSDSDGNGNSSEAIFVVQAGATVAVGDKVKVTGVAQETSATPSFNQAVLTSSVVTVLSSGHALPAFTALVNATYSAAEAEKYEGMLVAFTNPLTVAEVRNVKQFGELILSTNSTLYQPTQAVDPNDNPATGTTSTGAANVAAVKAYELANANKSIVLDDGSALSNPSPTPYLDATLQTVRANSTISNVKGILGYGFNTYRIQPLAGAGNAPVVTVARPTVPTFTKFDVKLASFNVLNYFNGDGQGGGFPTARGARTPVEFSRQRSKIIKALTEMNADVVGLIEIENDGTEATSAIQDLVNGLNTALGSPVYSIVQDGTTTQPGNTDAIRCAIIYKPAVVQPLGAVLLGTDNVFERPPIAQVFTLTASPDTLTYIVNHFKSKASGTGVDADQGDGQGPSNNRRKAQALGLLNFVNTTVIPAGNNNIVSVGDYNAYFEEDPLDILRAGGLTVTGSATSISYVFDGLSGSLDHAVLSAPLTPFATVKKWNINAEEPEFLQYNLAGAATDVNSPYRSSDHDPLLIALDFPTIIKLTAFTGAQSGNKVKLDWTVVNRATTGFVVERTLDGKVYKEVDAVKANKNQGPTANNYSAMDYDPVEGVAYYRLKQVDTDGTLIYSPLIAVEFEAKYELVVYPNPVNNYMIVLLVGNYSLNQSYSLELISSQTGQSALSLTGNMLQLQPQINRYISRVKAGIYTLRLTGPNAVYTQRIVKQ